MGCRVKKTSKPPLFAPAGDFLRKLSSTNSKLRRKFLRYGLMALGAFFLYSTLVGDYSMLRIIRLEMEKQSLVNSNRDKMIDVIDAERIRTLLQSDAHFIEMIARTKYHLVRPGETMYRYRGQR
jgi:cell division protein FtsB